MQAHVVHALLICQMLFVLLVALHAWFPRDRRKGARRHILATAIVALPYAVAFQASMHYATTRFPGWLMWMLWIGYGSAVYGMMKAWRRPHAVSQPVVVSRAQALFVRPDAISSMSPGVKVNTLYVGLQTMALMTLALLGVVTFVRSFA